jgi:endonuclease/exonuclease/phosphatase family metal-dependent hydrolase
MGLQPTAGCIRRESITVAPASEMGSVTTPQTDAADLTVATYNIHSGIGVDKQYDLTRVIRVIGELDADIVGLQEVATMVDAETVELIAVANGYTAVEGPNIVSHRGRYGNLLLSRWPIAEFRLLDLSVASHEPRGAIEARVQIGESQLRIIVTHLGLRRAERRQQLTRLREAIAGDDTPGAILGDFNAPTRFELWRAGFGGHRGFGFAPRSFPANVPLLALDRIWTRPESILRSVRAHRTPLSRIASDHLPVIADLSLPGDIPGGDPRSLLNRKVT